jgi:hypothetical protein
MWFPPGNTTSCSAYKACCKVVKDLLSAAKAAFSSQISLSVSLHDRRASFHGRRAEPLLQCIKKFRVAVDSELSTLCAKAFITVLVAVESYLCWSLSVSGCSLLRFSFLRSSKGGHDPASSWLRCGAGAACDVGVV